MATGSKCPRVGTDPRSRFDAIFPTRPQVLSLTAADLTSTAFAANCSVARVFSTVDCFFAIGTSPSATTTGHYLPAGVIEYFGVPGGGYIAAKWNGVGGTLYVTEGDV